MEIKSVFKTMVMTVACLSAVVFASCSNDDDNKSMKFSSSAVEIGVDSTQSVSVLNCTTPLTATSSDNNTATVTVDSTTLKIKGIKDGTATISVTDASKQTGSLIVKVKQMLAFDKASVSVAAGNDTTVTVKSGTAPYTVAVKDASIATATVKDATITVKGVKAGTTTITVTDSKNVAGTIKVTVSK